MTEAAGATDTSTTTFSSTTTCSSTTSLYTAEQRQRRDASPWTQVQGVLAAAQFLAFLISVALVLRFMVSGDGLIAAGVSVLVKTGFLYAIMITGALWERDVFGRYLFAPAFFWEDVVSMAVIALHTAYLVAWISGWLTAMPLMWLALAAYALYLVNAGQFLWKFRQARVQGGGQAPTIMPIWAGSA